ncbi:MAG: hypothetical protein L0G89_11880 [Janibacter sp.]|nr:hypothetical protein [Janibacter sp.]
MWRGRARRADEQQHGLAPAWRLLHDQGVWVQHELFVGQLLQQRRA